MLGFVFLMPNVIAEVYTLEFNQIGGKVIVKETLPSNQIDFYLAPEVIEVSGKNLYFLKKVSFEEDYSEALIRINLEERITVNKERIFPEGYYFEKEGQRLSINWKLNNVKEGDVFSIFVELKETNTNLLYALIGVIIFFSLEMIILYLIRKKFHKKRSPKVKAEKIPQKNEEKYDHLLETEKKVIEELKKAERNEMWQKQIQNATGFSKAKVSRLIRDLDSRGLISKISFGNTNKIRLK